MNFFRYTLYINSRKQAFKMFYPFPAPGGVTQCQNIVSQGGAREGCLSCTCATNTVFFGVFCQCVAEDGQEVSLVRVCRVKESLAFSLSHTDIQARDNRNYTSRLTCWHQHIQAGSYTQVYHSNFTRVVTHRCLHIRRYSRV